MADRQANAVWEGDLFEGSGTVSTGTTGLFRDAAVTWAARTEDAGGKTSPEELLAAAHAACFSMAFANELSGLGHPPARLETSATVTFEPPTITRVVLDVRADVPGIDDDTFRQGVSAAEGSCPVSNALQGNVEIEVNATRA
ncbi:MAG: OsmC family peroxiredoxin [Acidimicrobiales bacterium]